MAEAATESVVEERRSEWGRKYPPVVSLLAAAMLALFVLPSSLNLPQANPATTLELAPVPPTDEDKPPPNSGNVASFGLGSSDSVGGAAGATGGAGLGNPDEPGGTEGSVALGPSGGKGKTSKTKRCVGNPPRQTEDPLSPPCVADFEGDNGGATYQGVTKDEIRILIYYDTFVSTGGPRGTDTSDYDTIVDIDRGARPDDIGVIIAARAWQAYFNLRYQTYGRRVHFYLQFGSYTANADEADTTDAASRQADAAKAFSVVKPFAIIDNTSFDGNSEFYIKYMAEKGVLNFGSVVGREDRFFKQFPKLLWGYTPTVEQVALEYTNFVCKKVAPYPVSFSSTYADGTKRKYGLVYTTDEGYPSIERQAKLVKSMVKEKCNVDIASEVGYPRNGYVIDNSQTPQYATDGMLQFKQAGVTTILWPAGTETKLSAAGTYLAYFPEWILGADLSEETTSAGQAQDQANWSNAWIMSFVVKTPIGPQQLCYQAFREVDTTSADADALNYACKSYNDLRQLFTGIQVAGPKLGPSSIDKGYHAIPAVASIDPRVPACFYKVGDYTCVKDAMIEWWDPAGKSDTSSQNGCWKMILDGGRFLEDEFPDGNVDAQKNPAADKCNNFDLEASIDIGA